MLLYVVEQESSRTLCCKVYKRIGVVFRRPCLLECDKRRVYIWQRPCLCKCDGGRNLICKPSVCLLWSFHTCPIHPNWVDSSEALYDSTRFARSRSTLPEVKIREIMMHEPSSFLKRGNKLQSIRLRHFTIRLDSHGVDPHYRKSRSVK